MRLFSLRMTLAMPALALCLSGASFVDGALLQASAQAKKSSHRVLREGMFGLTRLDFATVVMLGDSLTEGALWSEITGCAFVVNRGIGGDKADGISKRLDEVTKLKPTAVFLMVGVNDIASDVPVEKIVDRVRQTIRRLTKAGSQVYLTLVLPVAESFTRKLNPKINELNAAYTVLALQTKVTVIDFRADMRTEEGFLRDELSVDGLHLAPDGYRIWRDAVMPLVAKHCSQDPRTKSASAAVPAVAR